MAEARKRRELLPLIYQHLLQAGYVRAAREVKEQSGQKNLLAQPVTLLDIYTHWQQTSEVGQKRKAEDDAALQAKKKRVSDPVSSSESSEEEEEEAEAPRTAPRVSLTNSSAVRTVLPTDLKEKTPAKPKASKMGNSTALPTPGKTVAQLLSGKSPRKSSGPSADAVLVSETEEEGSVRAAGTPGPPGVTSVGQASSSSDDTSSSSDETDVEVKPSVKAAQVRACPAPAKESPGKKAAPAPGKTAVTPPAQLTMVNRAVKQEVDSESTEGSESEEEGALVAAPSQGKGRQPSEKPGQARGAPGATPAKGTPGKGVVSAAPGKAASATPRAQPGRPQEDSETSSSEESDSEEEAPATTTPAQAKPSGKPTQVRAASALTTPSPRKGAPPAPTSRAGPAASQSREEEEEEEDSSGEEPPHRPASARAAPAQAKSLGKSPQSKAAPARGPSTGPPGKGAAPSTSAAPAGTRQDVSESSSSSSSSDESDSDEEAPPSGPPAQVKAALKTPLTQVSPRKGTPVPPVPAKATTARAGTLASPALARAPQKPEDSSSSEESESEEEMAAAVGQPQALRKSLPVRAALTPTKAPSGQGTTSTLPQKAGPAAAPTRVEVPEDSTSSEDSDSDGLVTVRTPAQVPAKTLQTKPTPTPASPRAALPKGAAASGKVAPAAAAAKQGSPAKAKLPARSPAVGKGAAGAAQARSAPTGAEEDSDSSEEDSDSSEGAPPAQAKAPGLNSQVRAAPSPAKGSPRKGARPAPPGTPGPTAPSAGRRQDAECSSSSSSSTESDSEEDAPAPGSTTRKESNSKASGRKAPAATPQKKPEGSLESSEVIKLPLIFVDPNRSPAGPAAAPARAQAAGGPRKARASESTAGSSSSESEDEDVIPATQCSTPAISLSAVSGPMALPRGSPKAAPAGTSSSKTSSQGTDGKKQQATGTQVTKKPGGLPLTQATLRVLAQTANEAQAPAARTPPATGVGATPKTHTAATAHGIPTHARAAAPSAHTKADDSGTSGDSEDSSPESEENPPPRLDAASSKETVVEETSAESSEDEEPEPSQAVWPLGPRQPLPSLRRPSPGRTPVPRAPLLQPPKMLPVASRAGGPHTQQASPPPAAGVSGRSKAGTSPQTPQKEALSPQAYVLALQSDIAQRLLSEPRTQSKAQAQASVVKVLAELLEQERRKALEATKDSGGKGRSGHKRKLQGDQATAKAPEKRKKQLATQEGGEGTASPEKAPGTSRGKPKKDRPSGDSKKKKKKKADPNCCVATGKPEGTQGQGDIKGGSLKNKKDKSSKKKKDKEKKEKKKKAKKASTKDSDAILQKKKKKKKKKAEAPV